MTVTLLSADEGSEAAYGQVIVVLIVTVPGSVEFVGFVGAGVLGEQGVPFEAASCDDVERSVV